MKNKDLLNNKNITNNELMKKIHAYNFGYKVFVVIFIICWIIELSFNKNLYTHIMIIPVSIVIGSGALYNYFHYRDKKMDLFLGIFLSLFAIYILTGLFYNL